MGEHSKNELEAACFAALGKYGGNLKSMPQMLELEIAGPWGETLPIQKEKLLRYCGAGIGSTACTKYELVVEESAYRAICFADSNALIQMLQILKLPKKHLNYCGETIVMISEYYGRMAYYMDKYGWFTGQIVCSTYEKGLQLDRRIIRLRSLESEFLRGASIS